MAFVIIQMSVIKPSVVVSGALERFWGELDWKGGGKREAVIWVKMDE